MDLLTADLIDQHGDALRSCEVQFRQYGKLTRFHGPVRTLRTFEDNVLLKRALSEPGNGAVLVVDGAASLRCCLFGDYIAALGLKNGWAGLIVWGAVRDVVALGALDLGIKAVGSSPRRSGKRGVGEMDVPLAFGGATFRTGDWVCSDEDGVVVSDSRL